MKTFIAIVICALTVATSVGEVITVDDNEPADFDNIQAAIEYAQNGDTIIVKPGTYNENVRFNNKAITLTSTAPDDPNVVNSTIITSDTGYSVSFDANEVNDSILTGFTITGRGVYCNIGTSPTISKNTIRDCSSWGIYGKENIPGEVKAAPIISNNIISNNKGGIAYCDGPVTNNVITKNEYTIFETTYGGGLSFCNGEISGNIISDNFSIYKGGACYGCNGNISNNIITGNSSFIAGGALCNCFGDIHNNIITGNKCDTSGGALFGCNNVYNNTIAGNYAAYDAGAVSLCFGDFKNNIIMYNRSPDTGGIKGQFNNFYNCFWANSNGSFGDGAAMSPTDIFDNPGFAIDGYWDTNGTSDENDDFWVNGDYHLKSEAGRWDTNGQSWVQDDVNSPCIDAGDPNTALIAELWPHGNRVNIGAYGNTNQASLSSSDAGNIADLNYDGWVDYKDMALLTGKWLWQEVLLSEDINRNGSVNLADIAILLANWNPMPLPPKPDPMTWEMEPTALSTTSIVMVAAIAASSDDSSVEYYFKCDTSGGHDSGWQDEPGYTDTGLIPGTQYFYRVKARNKRNLVETGFSEAKSATTIPLDTTKPTPNPAQWQTEPYPVPPSSIRMVAVTATDASGVEYFFECSTNSAYSSGWQDSPEYVAISLPKGTYSFVVRARDKSPNQNTTGNSATVVVDLQSPSPDPMQWAANGEPKEVLRGSNKLTDYWAVMTAAEATDAGSEVQYFFECTDVPGLSSNWQSSPYYEVRIGRGGQLLEFRVKAHDADGNETAFSSKLPAI
ncbi:MAG: right-handed parallel beta-helix repeat-containing protein [Sedimentisphaerales bacterium]|nr:right-handed parallel beta-helix repeat-containing protein [Sedimentisphaerales bacterium]